MKEKTKNKSNFFKEVRGAWRSIRFMPKKTAFKRTGIVLISMLILGVIISLADWIIGNGFKVLSLMSFNLNIAKIIFATIFTISALVVIIFGTLIKSETKSFSAPVNKNYYDKRNDSQYMMNKILFFSSVVCFIGALGTFIFQ